MWLIVYLYHVAARRSLILEHRPCLSYHNALLSKVIFSIVCLFVPFHAKKPCQQGLERRGQNVLKSGSSPHLRYSSIYCRSNPEKVHLTNEALYEMDLLRESSSSSECVKREICVKAWRDGFQSYKSLPYIKITDFSNAAVSAVSLRWCLPLLSFFLIFLFSHRHWYGTTNDSTSIERPWTTNAQ
jgi:hypothetical protein